MLLIVGIIAFLAFLTGVIILLSGGEERKKDAEVTIERRSHYWRIGGKFQQYYRRRCGYV